MADGPNEMLGMSDEDFLNMSGPPASDTSNDTVAAGTATDTIEAASGNDTVEAADAQSTVAAGDAADTVSGDAATDTVVGAEGNDTQTAAEATDTVAGGAAADGAKADADAGKKEPVKAAGSGEATVTAPTPEQASDFFMKVMAPFKANGKTIQLKTPDEAIQLMQMGANYTRKMQDIQPHRKVLLMLQNNELLDEGKLSFLIDLDKKNPEAIKKLIKESGIDPMEIDTSIEPAYRAGNHQVSDEEAGFRNVLDEVNSTPAGQETIQLINQNWDTLSKEALWKSPQIVAVIHEQRENGVYAKIVDEMDRQKTLGTLPATVPFLQAYKAIGDQLAAANQLGIPQEAASEGTDKDKLAGKPEPAVVATRVAAPQSQVDNGAQATAAATTRTTPRKAEKLVNPLALSDEEFLKHDKFKSRV